MGLGRWFLDEMDRLRDLTLVLEHDGRRMAELTVEVKTNMVDLSYRTAASLIAAAAPEAKDPEATAVLLLGALVALRRTAWTFGFPPLDIDDDRALTAWTELTLATLNAGGDEDRPSTAGRATPPPSRVRATRLQGGDVGPVVV